MGEGFYQCERGLARESDMPVDEDVEHDGRFAS
jgi:hypothetical protein